VAVICLCIIKNAVRVKEPRHINIVPLGSLGQEHEKCSTYHRTKSGKKEKGGKNRKKLATTKHVIPQETRPRVNKGKGCDLMELVYRSLACLEDKAARCS